MALKDIPEIGQEFAGWEGWQSLVGGQMHARKVGAVPAVMVHADSLEALREQVRLYQGGTVLAPGRVDARSS